MMRPRLLALNRRPLTQRPLQLNRETIWRTNHAWPEAPRYIRVYSSSRVAQLLRGSFVVKSSFQKEIHAVEIDNCVTIVERVHPKDPGDSGGALSQREIR